MRAFSTGLLDSFRESRLTPSMALRVLLADESVTIKKVFQLALQDFGIEVTPVTVGVDVISVAQKMKPDIVFADVLLQKKSGYDVCRELKSNPDLARIPVVLIWSGFMELDESRFKSSGASAHLEKPFDTQRLRQVIQDLVPKTKTQPMSGYLSFPKLPDFDESPTSKEIPLPPKMMPTASPTISQTADGGFEPMPEDDANGWSMDNFAEPLPPMPALSSVDEPEDFLAVKLQSEPTKRTPPPPKPTLLTDEPVEEDAQWVQKTLSKYKLDPAQQKDIAPKVSYREPDEKINPQSFVSNAWARPKEASKENLRSKTKDEPLKPERAGGPPPLAKAKPAPPPLAKHSAADDDDDDVFELESSHNETETLESAPTTSNIQSNIQSNVPSNIPAMNEKQLEAIIRAQSAETIEKVVWQIVPEIATRIIERELERLLRERDKK
jgi:two-component system, cell cycle response regulator